MYILPTKTTTAQSEDALSYDRMRGLYFLAVVFAATIHYKIYGTLYTYLRFINILKTYYFLLDYFIIPCRLYEEQVSKYYSQCC